jgi:cytochrome b561
MDPVGRYTRPAIVLHWLIAIGVLAQFALGWWMIDLPKSPLGVRAWWFNFHKSIGLTLGLFILARVAWRSAHSAPALPSELPRWQRLAALTNHAGLYLCMVLMPVSGYLGSSFTKYPIKHWGMTLPQWGWDSLALKDLCSAIHYVTVWVFMTLVCLHVLAALRHLLLLRDGIFWRMWPTPRN